jgi:DNA repair protein RecO (recombination protein O)
VIVSSEAVILKAIRYGDTSKIVTAYTKEFGKVSLMAKGARSRQSKFGSALEPLSHSHLVFYKKADRDLQLLSQADAITQYRHITGDHTRLASAFAMIELVHATTQSDEKHEELFDLLISDLAAMNDAGVQYTSVLLHFIFHLTMLQGFEIDVEFCTACRRTFSEDGPSGMYDAGTGGFICTDCAGPRPTLPLSTEMLHVLQRLKYGRPADVSIATGGFHAALDVLLHHIHHHIPEMRRLKSLSLLGEFS